MSRFAVSMIGTGLAALVAATGAILHACVPADTRPPPGTLTITVSPSPAVRQGIVTADGWTIAFDRVLVAIGNTSLGRDCISYSGANYDRLLDVTTVGAQKLSMLHGLGQCDVRFRISSPSSDALLGSGVGEADKTAMRTPGGDPYVPLGGIAIDIAGSATRGAITKRFHIVSRQRVRYQQCALAPDAAGVNLESNVDLTFDVRIEAEAFLRDDVDAGAAALRFDPFAAADKNGDGIVTLDELRQVPIGDVRDGGAFEAGTYAVDDAGAVSQGKPIVIESLGDYVYLVLLPAVPRFRDVGTCLAATGEGRGEGHGPD